jgi:hypothetical protein
MAQEQLEASQIDTSLQQVTRKRMAQQMWIHGCAQLRLHARLPTEEVDRFARDGLSPIVAREEPGARFISLPILPEKSEQTRGEHHAAILLPFPLADAEHHTGTIDISDLQVTEFRDPQAGRVEGREHRPRFEAARGQEKASPKNRRNLLRQAVFPLLISACEDNQKTWVKSILQTVLTEE